MIRISPILNLRQSPNPNPNNQKKTTIFLGTILGLMFSSSFIKKYYEIHKK